LACSPTIFGHIQRETLDSSDSSHRQQTLGIWVWCVRHDVFQGRSQRWHRCGPGMALRYSLMDNRAVNMADACTSSELSRWKHCRAEHERRTQIATVQHQTDLSWHLYTSDSQTTFFCQLIITYSPSLHYSYTLGLKPQNPSHLSFHPQNCFHGLKVRLDLFGTMIFAFTSSLSNVWYLFHYFLKVMVPCSRLIWPSLLLYSH